MKTQKQTPTVSRRKFISTSANASVAATLAMSGIPFIASSNESAKSVFADDAPPKIIFNNHINSIAMDPKVIPIEKKDIVNLKTNQTLDVIGSFEISDGIKVYGCKDKNSKKMYVVITSHRNITVPEIHLAAFEEEPDLCPPLC